MPNPPRTREPELIHQLKNHLSVIVGFSELMRASAPAGTLREDLDQIHEAATAALTLVPELVTHYRD